MRYLGCVILTLFLCSSFARAQERKMEAGFRSDNDSFLGQGSDRYYTNGFFLFFRKAANPAGLTDPNVAGKVYGLEIGQKIFNARSGSIPSAAYVDRPVAGYLYLALSDNILFKNETSIKLTGRLGVIGPAAGGSQVQQFIHDTFGFYALNSWQYQVCNTPVIDVSGDITKLLTRASWVDLSLYGSAELGTGFTGAGIGPLLRMGNFNQLYRSVSTQSTAN